MANSPSAPARLIGAGLVLGAGLGATAAAIGGFPLALGGGYGAGAGIVLGAAVRWLVLRGAPLLAGGALAGLLVGGANGAVGAWSSGVAAPVGAVYGGGAGIFLGAFLAVLAEDWLA